MTMETKEMLQLVIQIEKLHEVGNYEDILCILTDLHNAHVSLVQLQTTDVAIRVYQLLKTCPVTKVRKSAKGLLSKWKRLYGSPYEHRNNKLTPTEKGELISGTTKHLDQNERDSETVTSHKVEHNIIHQDQETGDHSSKDATISTVETSLPKPKDLETVPSGESPTTLTLSPQTGSFTNSTTLRAKCVELLLQAINPDQKSDPEQTDLLHSLAQTIETHIYTIHGSNLLKYKSCIRSKIANLKNKKSPHLRHGLLTGTLASDAFVRMSAEEMAGEELRRLRQDYTEASIGEHQMPHELEGTPTTKVRCQRCEGTDCRMTQVSRGTLFLPSWVKRDSADEDALTFMTCTTCGAQWYHNRWVCL
ncbi:transcription elongation factor A N-terminal and central domain-containing protein [Trichomycterus rosablanca]|uniref:transcription elongation factor A N-terminal and central domain-containing protein n=1 Tax=Trichomycterus rosablanca TaxID=2290929 RepID=UPI002F35262C